MVNGYVGNNNSTFTVSWKLSTLITLNYTRGFTEKGKNVVILCS